MSELQKYVALGPLRAAHPGDEINQHIWYATPEVDARLAMMQRALEWLLSEIDSHNMALQEICGFGDNEAVACKYRQYLPRRCPDCPRYRQLDLPEVPAEFADILNRSEA